VSELATKSDRVSLWGELTGVPFRQHFVTAGGIRTRVIEAGDPTLPHLVLLHGTGGHAEAFLRNLPGLSPHFHLIAYDMVGHGWSDAPDKPYTLDVYAEHLQALLETLGIERCHLSGESLGGWVAAWYAAHDGPGVDRLVLAVPGNVTAKPETMVKLRDSTRKAVVEASPETVRARLEWLFAPDNRHLVPEELVDVRLAIYSRPGAVEAVENLLVLQDPDVRRHYTWTPEWCGRISAPTLILWTEHDPTGPVEEGHLLHGWIPGSELVVMEDAGHWPQWERPEEFDRLHKEFLLA
jgi:2-hydroxy-6-oxonona-2,4-dienedioate hydrolase